MLLGTSDNLKEPKGALSPFRKFLTVAQFILSLFLIVYGFLLLVGIAPFASGKDLDSVRLFLGGAVFIYGLIRLGMIIRGYRNAKI